MIQTRDLMFLAYNPYSNRELKYESNAVAYNPYIITTQANVNFNPNDGITTQVIVNAVPTADFDKVDYCCVVDGPYNVESHWFVMEAIRTKGGQYDVTLRRDVFVDFNTEIATATSFVERGVPMLGDPAAINLEGYEFNKIKTGEVLLKDETECPWIVGYLNLNADGIADSSDAETFKPAKKKTSEDDLDSEGDWFINNEDHIIMRTSNGSGSYNKDMGLTRLRYSIKREIKTLTSEQYNWLNSHGRVLTVRPKTVDIKALATGTKAFDGGKIVTTTTATMDRGIIVGAYAQKFGLGDNAGRYKKHVYNNIYQDLSIVVEPDEIAQVIDIVNDELESVTAPFSVEPGYYAYDGTIYRLALSQVRRFDGGRDDNPELTNILDRIAASDHMIIDNMYDSTPAYEYVFYGKVITFEAVATPNVDIVVDLHKTWIRADKQPYTVFCMPMSDTMPTIFKPGPGAGYTTLTSNSDINWGASMALSKGLSGSKALVDLQLLPYCPLKNLTHYSSELCVDLKIFDDMYAGDAKHYMYEPFYRDDNGTMITAGFMYFVQEADFSLEVFHELSVPTNILDFKTANEVDQYILKSPNYNGQFEFKPTLNGGVARFVVKATYKPFNPYICVRPLFDSYYGQEFDDSRGLVCQGDFSLPQLYDAWMTYQMNNKNYVNTFNTQLQTMQKQKLANNINNFTNILTGGGAAGIGTLMATGGNPIAAVAGAGVGALGSAVKAGVSDAMFQQNIDQFKAEHEYNLENIKANQGSLQCVDAKTITNKLFPFIEYYTCTDEEREACKENIIWNGCTINRVGRFDRFINPSLRTFIKGRIINSPSLHGDNHLFNTINEELQKGVYIV